MSGGDDPYVYPGTEILRNKLDIRSAADLDRQEAQTFLGLRRPAKAAVATQLAKVIGDLNFVHPFREGNGRTQLQFARQLAGQAGHRLDLTRLNGPAWIEASREALVARYDAMARCFEEALPANRASASARRTRTAREGGLAD